MSEHRHQNPLGSPAAVQRHFEDEMGVQVLMNLAEELESALDGWNEAQPEERAHLRDEWPSTRAFGDKIAQRPDRRLSPLVRKDMARARARWFAVCEAVRARLEDI